MSEPEKLSNDQRHSKLNPNANVFVPTKEPTSAGESIGGTPTNMGNSIAPFNILPYEYTNIYTNNGFTQNYPVPSLIQTPLQYYIVPSYQNNYSCNAQNGYTSQGFQYIHAAPNISYYQSSIPTTPLTVCPYQQNYAVSNLPSKNIKSKKFDTGDTTVDSALNELVQEINPETEFVFQSTNALFFVIKSFSEHNIYIALKQGVWCSTQLGNEILSKAYKEVNTTYENHIKAKNSPDCPTIQPHVYLFFSVNSSGHFCAVAELMSDYINNERSETLWQQKKWRGYFNIKWRYVKDISNNNFKHIRLDHNENRSVTNSRDATEIKPLEKGKSMLEIFHKASYQTSLLDDIEARKTKKIG